MGLKRKTKNLAEDCFKICLSDFGKKLLYPSDNDKLDNFDLLCNKEDNALRGKQGYFVAKNGMEVLHIFYNVNQNRTPKVLEIRFQRQESEFSGTEQSIELEEDVANFGIRPFFKCQCGRNATVLYKPLGENSFQCRICGNTIYESQQINKKTMDGLFYQTHQLLKLAKREEKVKRKFYNGKFSRKWQRFIELRNRWNESITENMKMKSEYIFNAESAKRI